MSVQEKIQQLLWNKRYVCIPDDIASKDITHVFIRDFTVEDRNLHTFVRKRELDMARKQGVPTEAEIIAEARKVGLWTEMDELILAKADEHIAFLNSELTKQKLLARKKSLQQDIDKTIEKKRATLAKKNEYFINSADYYAAEAAAAFLVRRVVFTIEDRPLFPTDDSFLLFKRDNYAFIIFLINEVLSEGVWEIDDVREVARNPEWRLTWTLQRENLQGLFGRSVGDLTVTQKLVIYWSRVYDSAFESAEPPSADIVNDDDKFNEWLANREVNSKQDSDNKRLGVRDHQERMQSLDGEYIETCNCGMKAKNIGKGLGERLPHAATCRYGVFRTYSAEEKRRIANQTYGRNSDRVRTLIDQEQQAVVANGVLEEQKLRNRKTRHILGMKTDVVSINK